MHVSDNDSPDEANVMPATPRPSNVDSNETHSLSLPKPSLDRMKSVPSPNGDRAASSSVIGVEDRDRPNSTSVRPSNRKQSFSARILPSMSLIRAKSFSARSKSLVAYLVIWLTSVLV